MGETWWSDLAAALALVLVLEGITPFLNPSGLRDSLRMVLEMDDKTLRLIGLFSMLSGLALLYMVR
jgi:uncharacterized protein YjeT (DUF2065 family)